MAIIRIFNNLKYLILLFILGFHNPIFSQISIKDLGRHEIFWAIAHPFQIKSAINITKSVKIITDSIAADSILFGSSGGNLDAFKHCLWSSMLSNKIGEKKSRKLCVAHEKTNKIDFEKGKSHTSYEHGLMDSLNNEVGLKIGLGLKKNTPSDTLIVICLNLTFNSQLTILSIDKNGNYLDCHGVAINSFQKWSRGICLKKSNS